MRNQNRIDSFCKELAEQWHKVPDWRFGQLISNVMGDIAVKHGDIFFPEDDKMIEYIKDYFKDV